MPVKENFAGLGEIFNAPTAADHEFAEIDFLEGYFVDEVIALREGQKCVEEGGSSPALGDDLSERVPIFFFGAMAMKRELCGREHDSDGGPKIVRGVGRELTEARNGGLESCEELIPGNG